MRVLIACALIISIPLPAGAEGVGVIAASSAERGAVARAMADAIASPVGGPPPGRVVADAVGEARLELAAGAVPLETIQRFRRVRTQIEDGWGAYLRVAGELAASRLATARQDAEALVALPEGAELYADAALKLGAVLAHLGRTAEAQAVLALALAMDPERPITLAEFSPDVVAAADAARAAPVALQRVQITTEPSGAIVEVDGHELGRAPLEVQVTRGQHVIVARSPLHVAAVAGVNLAEPRAVHLALEPDLDIARLTAGTVPGLTEVESQQLIEATLRYADLDEVAIVAGAIRRGGPTLLVQRCAGRPARCSAAVELGYADPSGLAAAARAAWQTARRAELRYPPTVLGERPGKPPDGRCKTCRSPWLWTGVGAAVVLGTVITLVVTSSSRPPPIVGVDPGAFH